MTAGDTAILVATAFVGLVLLMAAVLFPTIEISRGFDHRSCTAFGQEANREVRFVEFTYFDWDCLTPTTDGKWISTARLRDFDE